MIDFLIKSTIGLIVFLGFYHLILEREKIHRFNRFFLLFSVVLSLIIPFVSFEIIKEVPAVISDPIAFNEPIVNSVHTIEKTDYRLLALWSFYFVVTLVLVIRFAINIQKIISKIKANASVDFKNSKLILVEEKILPHTFLNYIFINSEEYKNKNIEAELFTHELVHVTQKHTLDILFIEVMKTVFWFNPIFIFYKKAIQLNHEFLADQEIVKTYNNVPFYQNLLISKGNGKHTIALASNLNYSVTKKRLTMMKKTTSKNIAFTKKFAVLPVLVILISFLCIKTVAQEVKTNGKSGEKNVSDTEKYYSNTTVVIKNEKKDTLVKAKYSKLTTEQKKKVPPPPKVLAKNTPNVKEYEAFKNDLKYAVWIDGVNVSNAKLNDYKADSFVAYFNSFVHKNARSKKFPQEYQVSLYTEEGYNKAFDIKKTTGPETLIIGLKEETLEKKKEIRKSYGYRKMEFDTTMFRKPSY